MRLSVEPEISSHPVNGPPRCFLWKDFQKRGWGGCSWTLGRTVCPAVFYCPSPPCQPACPCTQSVPWLLGPWIFAFWEVAWGDGWQVSPCSYWLLGSWILFFHNHVVSLCVLETRVLTSSFFFYYCRCCCCFGFSPFQRFIRLEQFVGPCSRPCSELNDSRGVECDPDF